MNKKTIILSFVALIIALGMNQSVMAKKITYLGYQYNGKINKENIPEGKGTITMTVPNLIKEGEMSEFSIAGIFNGPVITNAYFETSWLSYRGDVEIKEENSFVLKKGGVITTNAYHFTGMNIRPELIQHYNIEVSEDTPANYLELKNVPITIAIPFSYSNKIEKLNPPATIPFTLYPSKCKTKTKDYSGTWGDSYIIYYDLNSLRIKTPSTFTDEEGRVWEQDKRWAEHYTVTYPDGSYCNIDTEYERVSPNKSVFITNGLYKLILPNGIVVYSGVEKNLSIGDTAPYRLKVYNDSYDHNYTMDDKAKEYVSGENKNLLIESDTKFDIYKGDGSVFNDYGRIKQIFNDSILPHLTIKEGCSVQIRRLEPDPDRKDVYTVYTALEYKDGVVKTEDQINKENDQKAAAEAAVYNKSIANFKKKYGFDPSVDDVRYIVKVGRNLLGILNARKEWVDEYSDCRNCIVSIELAKDQGSSKCYKFYWMNGAYYMGYFWVRNNVITSITWK